MCKALADDGSCVPAWLNSSAVIDVSFIHSNPNWDRNSCQLEIFSAAATLWPCGHDTSRPSTRSTDFHRSKSAFFKQSRCGASDEPPSAMGVTSRAGCLRRSAVPLPMRKQERVEVLSELRAMGLLDTRGSDDFAVVSPKNHGWIVPLSIRCQADAPRPRARAVAKPKQTVTPGKVT